jgi:hypothetical protein
MKPINDYFIGKPLDVKYDNGYNVVINRDELLNILKQIQIDTIRKTTQACADNADADVEFCGWFDDQRILGGCKEGEDYEVYVIKSSILEVVDKLIKELE